VFAVIIVIRCGTQERTESLCSSSQHRILPYVAFNKDAFPNCWQSASRTKSFSLPKQAKVFLRKFQAQYQAFVRFAVASSAALSAIALNLGPGFWNLSLGAGSLVFKRTLASTRSIYGASNPGPTLWGGT
jgi:hypothetical protein